MEETVASVDTTGLVGGLGEQYSEVKKGSLFSEERKRYLADKIIGFLYRWSNYLQIHLLFFFFGFV